jgi:REP element-mobilizing transposase RayT
VDIPERKALPHGVPSWVDPTREIYFITVNCRQRFDYGRNGYEAKEPRSGAENGDGNQLATPEISKRIFETVRHRQNTFLWWPHLFLLMPDHLHALVSFPPSGKTIQGVVSGWKQWTAKEIGIVWQRDFFEHRLRHDESRREKADYILGNPVRKKLVARPEDWPFVYFADGERIRFAW